MKTKLQPGDKVNVQCYKHDSSFHRSWEELYIVDKQETFVVGVNETTKVHENDGYFWRTREPAVSFFYEDKWFNILCMIRRDGIYYYCNLSSPYVYEKESIKYVDYDLDVKVYPDNSYDIVDQNEYFYHKKKMKYSADIGWILSQQLKELERWVKNKIGPFNRDKVLEYYDAYLKLDPKEKKGE